jgi:ribonucleoside-diphosphate reductase alpha chain
MTRNDETALQQLNRYLHVMRTWCSEKGHNQSATIYVREHEWDEVREWVYTHFDEITGLSFLPYDGGTYKLAPYEEITEEQYHALMRGFPSLDYSLLALYEREDMGDGAKEYACVGGVCTL